MIFLLILLAIVAATIILEAILARRTSLSVWNPAGKLYRLEQQIREAGEARDTTKMQQLLTEYEDVLHSMNNSVQASDRFTLYARQSERVATQRRADEIAGGKWKS